jgi:hypothetical protein
MLRVMNRRRAPRSSLTTAARFGLLALAVWVPAHDLVYLAAYGVNGHRHSLEASGHGAYWLAIGLAALLGLTALATVIAQRSDALRRRLGELGGVSVRPVAPRRLVRRGARLWLLLLAACLAVFVVQENLEHLTQHAGHLPGLGVLYAGEYAATLPIFAALALAAAAIGSLAIERLRALAEAVARAERVPRPMREARRPSSVGGVRPREVRSTPDLGRAPPPLLAA